ncbi:hypothetical protein THRCLA_11331, partial [Thraustotheca clavata]
MAKKVILAAGAIGVYGAGVLAAYVYKYDPSKDSILSDAERQARFDINSAKYDKEIGMDETMAGIGLMRRFLLKHAHGAILEVAAGTGRNLPYYKKDANVLLTDLSGNMLAQIESSKLNPNMKTAVMSAQDLLLANDSFDTVIDTFALCSVDDPLKMLQEMQRVCKQNGKILLLEHGRSHYDWLSYVLDKFAAKHAERWGCLWNR